MPLWREVHSTSSLAKTQGRNEKAAGGYSDGVKAGLEAVAPMIRDAQRQINLQWAVDQWFSQVKNRPLQNIYYCTLDQAWRQIIRHFGGNPEELCGPDHFDLTKAVALAPKEPT